MVDGLSRNGATVLDGASGLPDTALDRAFNLGGNPRSLVRRRSGGFGGSSSGPCTCKREQARRDKNSKVHGDRTPQEGWANPS